VYYANAPSTDDFDLSFFGDAFGGVGLLLDEFAIQVTRTDTGHTIQTFAGPAREVYEYSATFAPIALPFGNDWVGIFNDTDPSQSDPWGWATYDQTGYFTIDTTSFPDGPWSTDFGDDLAFQLLTPSAVPEPSSLVLCGIGLAVAGGLAAQRRNLAGR
jgi:hypothetical protein